MDDSNSESSNQFPVESRRRRGIQASRTKLMQALVNAGMKTQSDLAERIADIEGLDSAPRGLVNRVFRGEPVDPQSIERVVRALNVEGWQVYLTADDKADANGMDAAPITRPLPAVENPEARVAEAAVVAVATADSSTDSIGRKRARTRYAIWASVIIAASVIALLSVRDWRPQNVSGVRVAPAAASAYDGIRAILVATFAGERAAEMTAALETVLSARFTLLPGTARTIDQDIDPQQLLLDKNADAVITGQVGRTGRYLSIRLFMHTRGAMQQVWTEILPGAAAPEYIQTRLGIAARAIGLTESTVAKLSYPNVAAEQHFLQGHEYLDNARTEKNTLHALAEFESAVRAAPEYAAAHAGLCEAFISDSIRTGNVRRLDEATDSCAQAVALDPQSVEGIRAQGNLDTKQGRTDQALTNTTRVLELNPTDVDAMLIAAEALRVKNSNAASTATPVQPLALLQRAQELEPDNWKVHAALGGYYYSLGDIPAAVTAQLRAVELKKNVQTLNNLGAFYYCAGQFKAARAAFVDTKSLEPAEYVGDAQIAIVDYQLRDFERAAAGLTRAIQQHQDAGEPRSFQLWGNLAGALRMAGHKEKSIAAYQIAIGLVDDAVAKGDHGPRTRAFRVSYYAAMGQFVPDYLDITLRQSLLAELAEIEQTQSPDIRLHVAGAYLALGQREKALALRAQLRQPCPGFASAPEFDSVRQSKLAER